LMDLVRAVWAVALARAVACAVAVCPGLGGVMCRSWTR